MEMWDRIKEGIAAQNTSQEWIASRIGVRADLFRRWSSRRTMPNADQAVGIAEALGTTVEYLVKGEPGAQYVRDLVAREGVNYQPPERIASIVADLVTLNDSSLETVKTMVNAVANSLHSHPESSS
jgi:hypothetical protein